MIEIDYPKVPKVYQDLYEFSVIELGVSHPEANVKVLKKWGADLEKQQRDNVIQLDLDLKRLSK